MNNRYTKKKRGGWPYQLTRNIVLATILGIYAAVLLPLVAKADDAPPTVTTGSNGLPNGAGLAIPPNTGATPVVAVAPNTDTNGSPTIGGGVQEIMNAISTGTNLLWEVHGLYASGLSKKYGGGVGVVWPFTTYVFTSIRIDWVNGGFWMPQGNVGVQLPIHVFKGTFGTNGLTITPFTYAGVAVPLSGATIGSVTLGGSPPLSNDGQPTAILGAGAAIELYAPWHLNAVADIEEWTGFPSKQVRFGALFKI